MARPRSMPMEIYALNILALFDYFETHRLSVQSDPNITKERIQTAVSNQLNLQPLVRFSYPNDFDILKNGKPRWSNRVSDAINLLVQVECLTRYKVSGPSDTVYRFHMTDKGRSVTLQYTVNSTFDGITNGGSNNETKPWDIPIELIGPRRYERYQKLRR